MRYLIHKFTLVTLGAFSVLMLSKYLTPYLYTVYSPSQYLGVHTFLEFLSIFIAFATFSVVWLLKGGLEGPSGRFLLVLGTSFLTVGSIDLLHTLGFQGMPSFVTPSSYQKATFLWVLGRYCVAAGFLTAFVVMRDTRYEASPTFSRSLIAVNFVVIISAILLSTSHLYLIPPLFVEGYGLTPLKIHLEYGLILLYIIIFGVFFKYRAVFKDTVFYNLGYFLIFTIVSETAFTFYKSVYDTYNLIGHLYKICAYWFLFKAIYLSGIVNHFYILSEMGKMSAQLLTDRNSINRLLEIQMGKLHQLIPNAERIAFYVKEEGDIYRSDFIMGKFSESVPVRNKIQFQNLFEVLGPNIKLYNNPYRLLAKLSPSNFTQEIASLWQEATQLLYIPLGIGDQFYGFIMLYSFSHFRWFSDEDMEKALVFQKFASLAIAQVNYQETISRLSYEDNLTQLPNRRYFFEQMTEVQYAAKRYGTPFTLIFLDMNDLKYINDTYGHAAGDAALRSIADRLKQVVSKSDSIARLGGDEFGVILKQADLAEGQRKIAELQQFFSQLDLPDYKVSFSLAAGGATYPTEADTEEILLRLADARMYEHKRRIKEARKAATP